MWKKRLANIFVLLLMLQSVAALADMHASHQSGLKHLSFNHDHHHDVNSQENSSLTQTNAGANIDCHHCCHCHGVHHHWIGVSLTLLQPNIDKRVYIFQRYTFPAAPLENLLRPPIRI